MSNRVFTASVLVTAALCAAPVAAQHRIREKTTLEITLGANQIADKAAGRTYTLDPEENLFLVSGDVRTRIVVRDTNPLLFEYSAATATDVSPDYTASLTFAEALQKLLTGFARSGAAGQEQPKVDGFDPMKLRQDLGKLATEIEAIPTRLRESIGGADGVKQLQSYLGDPDRRGLPDRIDAQYAAMFTVARKCLGTPGELTINGVVPIDCDAPYLLNLVLERERHHTELLAATELANVRRTQAADARTRRDQAVAAFAKSPKAKGLTKEQIAAQAALDPAVSAAEKALALASAAQKAAEDALPGAQAAYDADLANIATEKAAGHTLREFLALAMSMDSRVQKQLQIYRDLLVDVDGVGTEFVAATHAYTVKDRQTTTIKIEARKKWQPFMTGDVKAAQTAGVRKVPVTTDAYRPAHLTPGAAFVLGFVKNPTFKAVKDGDAYKIVKAEEELTRYDVAAMLNITPNGWSEPTFGGFFQVGVSPKKDELGFYFGGGIQANTILTFGAGVMMQQVRKLGPGLTEASRLASPDDLKTAVTFKPGLYLHATVTLPQKK